MNANYEAQNFLANERVQAQLEAAARHRQAQVAMESGGRVPGRAIGRLVISLLLLPLRVAGRLALRFKPARLPWSQVDPPVPTEH